MNKLKPCPFCGHPVRVRSYQEEKTDWKIETHIECESEGCLGANVRFASEWGEDPDLFIGKWNNRKAPPPCPACEAAARERDALNALCDKQAAILSRVAVALRGPEPPQTRWSHHDLPERAERAAADAAHYRKRWADSVLMHTDAVTQRDDLRARLDALAIEMETDDRAGRLAHWITAVRAIAEKEAK